MTIESLVGNDLEGSYRGLIEVASRHLSEVLVAFKVIVSNPRLNRTTPKCRYRMWPFKQPACFYRANTRKTFWEPEIHGFLWCWISCAESYSHCTDVQRQAHMLSY